MFARLFLGAMALLVAAGCAPASGAADPTVLGVSTTGSGNSATVTLTGDTALIDVASTSGIGALTLTHSSGPFPQAITLRLALGGLEELRLAYDDQQIVVGVSSGVPHTIHQSLRGADGRERALGPGDPHWVGVELSPEQLQRPFPIAGGGLSLTLPPGLIEAAPHELSIRWVDFFR
jgi:hypothetical protein